MSINHEYAVDSVINTAVEIGGMLPESARPFFLAYCYQIEALGEHVLPMIALRLGVHELSEEAKLFAEWGDAIVADNVKRCEEIEQMIDDAGLHDECQMALEASGRLSRALPFVLRALPPSGALH